MPDALPDLSSDEALAEVHFGHCLAWSGQRTFRLADRNERQRAYEIDLGPTFDPLEHAARKALAVFDRAEARDFVELYRLSTPFTKAEILALAQALDLGFDEGVFAQSLRSISRFRDNALPCEPSHASIVRSFANDWANELEHRGRHRPPTTRPSPLGPLDPPARSTRIKQDPPRGCSTRPPLNKPTCDLLLSGVPGPDTPQPPVTQSRRPVLSIGKAVRARRRVSNKASPE